MRSVCPFFCFFELVLGIFSQFESVFLASLFDLACFIAISSVSVPCDSPYCVLARQKRWSEITPSVPPHLTVFTSFILTFHYINDIIILIELKLFHVKQKTCFFRLLLSKRGQNGKNCTDTNTKRPQVFFLLRPPFFT